MKQIKAFISYSTKQDEDVVNEFIDFMKQIFNNKIIFFKSKFDFDKKIDSYISYGDWIKQLQNELRDTDIIFGMITKNYINSQWFYMEVGGGLLFNKEIIPICIDISKEELPFPFNTKQAYNYKIDDITNLINILEKNFSNKVINLKDSFFKDFSILLNKSTSKISFNESLTLFNSKSALSEIEQLLNERKKVGNFLATIFNKFEASLNMESEIESDENGNCYITRRYFLKPKNVMTHSYYELYIDKSGEIEVDYIKELNTDRELKYIIAQKSNIHLRVIILFDDIIKRNQTFNFELKVYAENYISNLIDSGIAQIFYNNTQIMKTKENIQKLIFPNIEKFKNLKVIIINASDKSKIYNSIEPNIIENKKIFTVDLSSKKSYSDRTLIEIRLN